MNTTGSSVPLKHERGRRRRRGGNWVQCALPLGGVRTPPPLAAGMALDVQGGYRAMCGRSDGLPEKVHGGVWRQNSAVTAKWRWTCSHVADAAPEWPALLAAITTATPMLRAYPSYPTVALFHVSLTLRKN